MTTTRFMMVAAMMSAAAAAPLAIAEDPAAAFRDLCAKKAADGDSMAVAGADGWLFLRSELRHVGVGPFWGPAAAAVSRATSPDKADPLPAIVDFVEQMKARGIEVLVMPVPCKAVVYPEKLVGPADGRVDQVYRDFFAELAAKGVQVVDLAEVFRAERADGGDFYCKTDTHWSPRACERAARLLATRIGKIPGAKPEAFNTRTENRTVVGDLTDGKGSEELPARVVEAADTNPAGNSPLEDKASPVVVMGDSHCLVFHAGGDLHGTGAGLADQLAAELGRTVDVIGVRGSGATPARVNLLRRAKADPAYLANKKWIVWCFAAREFTESAGWSPVPFGGVGVGAPAR